jgi:hypothetical protein
MRSTAVAALLLLIGAMPASAQWSSYTCELYFAESEQAPPEARELLERAPNAAVKVCSDWRVPDTRSFEFVSAPLRGALGVCQITDRQIFKEDGGWTHDPPPDRPYLGDRGISMMVSEGECPRQSDPRYTITNNVSEGVFAAAVKFWKELSSGAGQDALFAAVTPIVRLNSTFREFESAVRRGATFKLVGVSLSAATPHHTGHYHFDLEGSPKIFSLVFDMSDAGLVVLGIGEFVY